MTEKENESKINPINVIAASAGTGKTYRLSQEYARGLESLGSGSEDSSIVATTFTNKAATELVERVRMSLLKGNSWQHAQSVLTGYVGTVNSICGRLLGDYAIYSGLSPDLTVISEDRLPSVFAIAVDTVINEFTGELHEPAQRLQIENWRQDVQSIINLARNNDLRPDRLEEFACASWEALRTLLSEPDEELTGAVLDRQLAEAVRSTLDLLPDQKDTTVTTKEAIAYLQRVHRKLEFGNTLVWQAWAKLAKLKVGASSRRLLLPLEKAASKHAQHPRLHDDIKTVIFGVFRCAAAAMEQYKAFKKQHGLIDFVDQEALTLRLLDDEVVKQSLADRVRVLLVDEFQDTSPIQLAVFLRLARIVDYSVWVGDEKQSIFGFRGSDPDLMKVAITKLVSQTGGKRDRLLRSYRSRPSLVAFTNSLLDQTDKLSKITTGVATIDEVERAEPAGMNIPLSVWWLAPGRREIAVQSLAEGVLDILENPDKWKVEDKDRRQLRNIRGSDIAVLCRRNTSRNAVAKALVDCGLTVATERTALLDTPEGVLVAAALRYMIDESDTLAVADIANLLLPDDDDWLDYCLEKGIGALSNRLPELASLRERGRELDDKTPAEILEIAITAEGILESIMAWGNPRQRMANLDSLRGLAVAYQDVCKSTRRAATPAGLVLYLHKHVRDGGNQPANPDEEGINVVTYHKAKGLEWPMVILYDLDTPAYGSAFGTAVESPGESIDPLNPLESRSIRFWPWPYGQQRRNVPLHNKALRTQQGRQAASGALAESLRLLYVGLTRGRDYLIFACKRTMNGTAWLDVFTEPEFNQRILNLSYCDEVVDGELISGVPQSLARFEPKEVTASGRIDEKETDTTFVFQQQEDPATHPQYTLLPSTAKEADFAISGQGPQTTELGGRLPLVGSPDMKVLGDCVHAFLAVDKILVEEKAERKECAERLLSNYSIDSLSADSLLVAGDRLHEFLSSQYPGADVSTEIPVSGRFGLRRVKGSIDLLLEYQDTFVIVDHKTFPGRFEEWERKALTHEYQLALYRYMVESATGKRVVAQFIHMPVAGAIVRLDCKVDLS